MKHERTQRKGEAEKFVIPMPDAEPESDWTDEELDAMGEFSDALVAGKNPDLEAHLARYPQFAAKLRPVHEFEIWFQEELERIKRAFPGMSMARLFGVSRVSKEEIRRAKQAWHHRR